MGWLQVGVKMDLKTKTNLERIGSSSILAKSLASRYRESMRKRFISFSKGGGDWPPLDEKTVGTTIKKSRPNETRTIKPIRDTQNKAKKIPKASRTSKKHPILRQTGQLLEGLNPSLSSSGSEKITDFNTVAVGFSNSNHVNSNLSISRIASIHHYGEGVPKRTILVMPDNQAIDKMRKLIIKSVINGLSVSKSSIGGQ